MSKREASKSHQPVSGGIVGSPVFWIAVIVVAVGGMIWLALPRTSQPAAASLAPAPAADAGTTAEVIPDKILGRWMRNDGGGYSLEFRGVVDGGKLDASYFNPSPINVSRAEWGREDGKLRVFVELRDRNYDGATYTLLHDLATDKLAGVYYQPALGQSFAVEFERER